MAGRPKTEVDRELFVNTINDAENEQTFSSMLALHKFIGEVLDLPFYTVANRIKEWSVPLKTQPGKRGRPAGSSPCAATSKAPKTNWPDFSELLAAFSGAGIEIKTSADILASPAKDAETNTKVRNGWANLRAVLELPVFPAGQK